MPRETDILWPNWVCLKSDNNATIAIKVCFSFRAFLLSEYFSSEWISVVDGHKVVLGLFMLCVSLRLVYMREIHRYMHMVEASLKKRFATWG